MSLPLNDRVKLVVFDLGGTVVDFGCLAPVGAFLEAFRRHGITVTTEHARGPMGLHKRDHIRAMLSVPEVAEAWQSQHGEPWTEEDVRRIYDSFIPLQTEIAAQHADLVPGALDCMAALRERGIKTAATTGYPRSVAAPVLELAGGRGFQPDAVCCADEVPAGRPAPWMIFRTMEALGVESVSSVVSVGDTLPDIEASRNGGVGAVGVTESSSEMGLSWDEFAALSEAEKDSRHAAVADKLQQAGADVVVRSLHALPEILELTG